jgi:hypothetical protein
MTKKDEHKFNVMFGFSALFSIAVAIASWNLFWGLAALMGMLVILYIQDSLGEISEILKKMVK